MGIVVQKFGGTSVRDKERLFNVARIITETYEQSNSVVAVVSAQGDTTDDLIEKAAEINPSPSKREMRKPERKGMARLTIPLAKAMKETVWSVFPSLENWETALA